MHVLHFCCVGVHSCLLVDPRLLFVTTFNLKTSWCETSLLHFVLDYFFLATLVWSRFGVPLCFGVDQAFSIGSSSWSSTAISFCTPGIAFGIRVRDFGGLLVHRQEVVRCSHGQFAVESRLPFSDAVVVVSLAPPFDTGEVASRAGGL